MIEVFNKIDKQFKSNENIIISKDENHIIILNKNNKREIKIRKEEYKSSDGSDEFIQYNVYFANNHWHLYNINELLELIQNIINDQELSVLFFKSDKVSFGSGISIENYNKLSLNFLSECYGYSEEYLLEYDIEITSWNGTYDIPRKPTKELRN